MFLLLALDYFRLKLIIEDDGGAVFCGGVLPRNLRNISIMWSVDK